MASSYLYLTIASIAFTGEHMESSDWLSLIAISIAIPSCITATITMFNYKEKRDAIREAWARGTWTNEGDIRLPTPSMFFTLELEKVNNRVTGLGLYGELVSPQLNKTYFVRLFKKAAILPWKGEIYTAVGWREIPLMKISVKKDYKNDKLKISKGKLLKNISDDEEFYSKMPKKIGLWHLEK